MQNWQTLRSEIEAEIDAIWLEEPLEIRKIRWGVIDTGAGSGGQSFTLMVHLEGFLMIFGANVFFRFVRLAHDEVVDIAQMRTITRAFLHKPFNVFEFMGDMGLHRLHEIGNRYLEALDSVETLEEYKALTSSMMTYVIRLHRWIHFWFPWNLGVAFPHRSAEDFGALLEAMAAERG